MNRVDGKLTFEPIYGTCFGPPNLRNHGLQVPEAKFLHCLGVYIEGHLETDRGRRIEAALRKTGSYSIYLCSEPWYQGESKKPIRLFPDPEPTTEISFPENYFLPYFNCHGYTFGDGEFWINPVSYKRDTQQPGCYVKNPQGERVIETHSIEVILEDEYLEVAENDGWDVAVLSNQVDGIVHSVKRENGIVLSKYDSYNLGFTTTFPVSILLDIVTEIFGFIGTLISIGGFSRLSARFVRPLDTPFTAWSRSQTNRQGASASLPTRR